MIEKKAEEAVNSVMDRAIEEGLHWLVDLAEHTVYTFGEPAMLNIGTAAPILCGVMMMLTGNVSKWAGILMLSLGGVCSWLLSV